MQATESNLIQFKPQAQHVQTPIALDGGGNFNHQSLLCFICTKNFPIAQVGIGRFCLLRQNAHNSVPMKALPSFHTYNRFGNQHPQILRLGFHSSQLNLQFAKQCQIVLLPTSVALLTITLQMNNQSALIYYQVYFSFRIGPTGSANPFKEMLNASNNKHNVIL